MRIMSILMFLYQFTSLFDLTFRFTLNSTLAKRLQTVIGEKLEWNVYHFPGESLTHDIATIENKHQQVSHSFDNIYLYTYIDSVLANARIISLLQKRNSFMLSVVYCKAGQRDPLQMFGNGSIYFIIRWHLLSTESISI